MKILITAILVLSLTSATFGQINKKIIAKTKDTVYVMTKDSLKVIVDNNTENISGFNFEKNMPWIGAILIGLLTVLANVLVSRYSRKSNKDSLDKQLEHNSITTDKQLSNAKEIALAQIENTRKINQMDFNKTVLSGNRQSWINDLRDLSSKILTKTVTFSSKPNITTQEFEELNYLITKTELMLNATKDKDFILALKELQNCYIDIKLGEKKFEEILPFANKVKQHTQSTLKSEWERVKVGE